MATPLINGINHAWANITLVLFGVPVIGITKISYKRKQKKDNNYGYGDLPVSRGRGMKEFEGSIEIYSDELKRIIAAAPNRDVLDIAPFDIQVVFSGEGIQAEKDVLRACEFTEEGLEAAQGDTKLLITLPLIIGLIER